MTATLDGELEFRGMCDASGGVSLAGHEPPAFIVADDDDNVLRTYDASDASHGGPPIASVDLSEWIAGTAKNREPDEARHEADIEGATLADGRAYWITSHARGDKGKKDDGHSRFFATELPAGAVSPKSMGTAYADLRRDIRDADSLDGLKLGKATKIDPEDEGGLNIEGLASFAGNLLIGFRNPLVDGRTLLVPLNNANDVVSTGARAKFGKPVTFDLGGRGIRDLAAWKGRLLMIAGPVGDRGDFDLYVWDGTSKEASLVAIDGKSPGRAFDGFGPEGLIVFGDSDRILVVSDDGNEVTKGSDGTKCGKLKPREIRSFRARWYRLTPG